ncbi:dihydrofolate reductase family protein [Microbacterium sp. 179-I 3D4 NHS]|uniref:dihydrofolate reductase family protein n=1 Tax=Microbacterium sp. 179-I 3D4 NHS TaxID=3142381 RepID=UPI0039A2278D
MTTHYYTASSLDGFIATTEHSLAWLMKQDFDPEGPMAYPAFEQRIGALAMGASTYEWLLREQKDEPWPYEQPTWVFTHRSLPVLDGADIRFAADDIVDVHAQMRAAAGEKNVWIVGGGDLAGQFADAGLLDEVWIQFAPVTLGSGAPLLPRALDLELVEIARNRDFLCSHYRVISASSPS